MQNEKRNKIYRAITIIILLFITFEVIFISYLAMVILKEHKLFSEKYEESIKKEFELLNLGLININEKNMESEKRISGKIDNINKKLTDLNKVYNNILKEEKKKRVESVYSDKELADKMRDAALLLKEGKINQAYNMYEIVSEEQPDNKDARFYMYYTLFLKNKFDRDEYPKIKKGFYMLEREGYSRKEMTEVLLYIETEKNYSVNIESKE